jgi:formate/nitrite transporter FocA (FNT family)
MELISRVGAKKAKMRLDKLFWNSVLAGPLLGFGCAITLSTNAAPWYQDNAPGLIRTIAACFFPIGLILVVLTGADLYTSNVMFLPVAYLHRRVSLLDVAKSWVISYFGNLGGMLFFCLVICGYGGVFDSAAWKEESVKFAVTKAVTATWYGIFLKAVGGE